MKSLSRIIAATSLAGMALAVGILTSSATPAVAQVVGGGKECTLTKVTTYTYYGSYVVAVTTLEQVCVTILD